MQALIVLKTNYADEFDLESFCIFPVDYWVSLKKVLLQLNQDEEYEIYFGTNESVYISIREFFDSIEEFEITEEQEEVIYSFLGEEFGTLAITSLIDSILEANEDEKIVQELFPSLEDNEEFLI